MNHMTDLENAPWNREERDEEPVRNEVKTFDDLIFEKHPYADIAASRKSKNLNCYQARMNFENGYGVSVLCGSMFYSNGVDSYELAVLYDDEINYDSGLTDDVLGYISSEEVTRVMAELQKF
jgi:hypothetical protein